MVIVGHDGDVPRSEDGGRTHREPAAQGETVEGILADYRDLEPDDIRACLAYARAVIAHDSLDAVRVAPK